jgi:UDP-glucose 4-epimerase
MKKNILITGGAGFIGSNLAERCLREGHNVYVADNLLTGKSENVPKEASFILMDISKEEDYKKLPEVNFDVVMHLAAQSSGEISDEKPELDISINALGTLLLLRWSIQKKVKRFLYASSMAVYGDPKAVPVSEEDACRPLSFYGITKLAGENYVQHYSRKGLNTTCFRMFSVYGPGQDMENLKQGMVSIYMAYILKNQPIHVKGSKERFRDFTYIDDVVDGWMTVLDKPKTFGGIYNLAGGEKTTVGVLVEKEIKAFNLPGDYPVKYAGTTPSDQFGLYADISKIRSDAHWTPKTSLQEGLKKMAEWAMKTNGYIKDQKVL